MTLSMQENGGLPNAGSIRTIEWDMMNKAKFYPLSMVSSFSVRCIMYPFTVIKTRIQIQKQSDLYRGTFDAFYKISKQEGFTALYKGFWVSAFQIVSGVSYITTYETVRHLLHQNNIRDSRLKALIGGGCASLVGQTIIVPFDIISQHMIVLGMPEGKNKNVVNPLKIDYINKSKMGIVGSIMRKIYYKDGFAGFYKGYFASILAYVPNSALWWTFYHFYQDHLEKILPVGTSTLLLQCIAAPLGGATTTILTNPLDIIRARLQVYGTGNFMRTSLVLWKEERFGILRKGLSARMYQSIVFSGMIVLGYESVKRLSVSEEYKALISW
ncbi:Solute carrier family 25 member 44 [Armadillidium nasatum]|uniref:Solute carrier family 25 member 44 n=1 Tax=Armadillidium nasatum TaxID=96803 RepID=A0A5N5T0J3_9CRUS|nr:Solute carrier family 25 member 44 [Armadillidium nasatum]